MEDEREAQLLWVGFGGMAPIATAMALVGVRRAMLNSNIALILVTVVVLVAIGGGRAPGAVAALSAALSFDFFHTRPYLQLQIASPDDVETTLCLLAVGLIVGHVAASRRRARSSAVASHGEIERIYRVAELAARGVETSGVIMAAQEELTAVLHLLDCRFEAPPFPKTLDRLERSGALASHRYHLQKGGFELPPDGVELPVFGRGHLVGRFVLSPRPGTGVSFEERVVAVAVADQVGAVLASVRLARAPEPSG